MVRLAEDLVTCAARRRLPSCFSLRHVKVPIRAPRQAAWIGEPGCEYQTFDDICAFALEIPSAAIASKIHLDLLMRSPNKLKRRRSIRLKSAPIKAFGPYLAENKQAPLLIRESPIFPHNWKLATGDCPGLSLFVGIHDGKQWRGDQYAPERKQHAKHDGSQDRRPNGHPRLALHDVGLQ